MVLLGIEDCGGGGAVVGGRGPAVAELVLEVDGGGVADLVGDGGFGEEAEEGEGEVGLVGGSGEGGLGGAAGLRGRGEGVEEALGEELEGIRVPLHGYG